MLTDSRTKGKSVGILPLLEELVRKFLALAVQWLLLTFFELQDAFLAIGSFRRVVVYALAPRVKGIVLQNLRYSSELKDDSFENLSYYVSEEARFVSHLSFSLHVYCRLKIILLVKVSSDNLWISHSLSALAYTSCAKLIG